MGKQVSFYMTGADEEDFVRFVRSDRNVGIFMYAMPSRDIPLLTELPKQGVPFWFALYLWDREHSSTPRIEYVPEQRYYVVEPNASEVVEFERSHFDEGRLVRGRIWAETDVWQDNGTRQRKSEPFRKWFGRLANWIRRRSIRDEHGDYLLPGAAGYAKQGGELVEAVFSKSVSHFRYGVDKAD